MTRPTMTNAVALARRKFLKEKAGTGPTAVYADVDQQFRTLHDQYPAVALMAAAIAITDLTGSAIGAGSAAALEALDINNFLNG